MSFEIGIMTFGEITEDPVTGTLPSPRQRAREIIEQAQVADQVGLDVFGVGEHHRSDFVGSAPAVLLAAAAEKTEILRTGLQHGLDPLETRPWAEQDRLGRAGLLAQCAERRGEGLPVGNVRGFGRCRHALGGQTGGHRQALQRELRGVVVGPLEGGSRRATFTAFRACCAAVADGRVLDDGT
ncbi:LLM class flavin-dependent oxidoreductase [Streptomyces sp. NPDC003393]